MKFNAFPKIPRYSRDIIITEKIDGTNASIHIVDVSVSEAQPLLDPTYILGWKDSLAMIAASRTRYLALGKKDDNHGFACWVQEHIDELWALGPGAHFGEWWGGKIQRGYGLTEKRFSLFNVSRWARNFPYPIGQFDKQQVPPSCCDVVPTLYMGPNTERAVLDACATLAAQGSYAAPGYMNPEGIVVFHTAGGALFKKTLKDDEKPKGSSE